jgi:E3 ubiquitin-protein ligase ZNF598
LCADAHKNIYYKEYDNLQTHFALSHHICPYELCKAKCYVAFKTEDELRAHLDIEHNLSGNSSKGKIKANALLGF